MTTRLKIMLWTGGVLALILAFTRFGAYKDNAASAIIAQETARVEAKYQADIADLQKQIAAKQVELTASRGRAAAYREKLSAAEAKLRTILRPATASEAKQRLKELGYEVR